jgi:Glycosyl transferase family 2
LGVVSDSRSADVTICIPTRNRASWLAEAVVCVLAQTYPAWRLLVSDNASSDETASVIERVNNPRVRYFHHAEDIGMRENHNFLLGKVDTEFVIFTGDDDRLYPEHLERTVAFLRAHPEVGLVHTGFDLLDRAGHVLQRDTSFIGYGRDTVEPGSEFIRKQIRHSNRVASIVSLCRTDAVPAEGFRREDSPPHDFGLWLRLALDWDVGFLASPLGACRVHAGSDSAASGQLVNGAYAQHREMVMKLEEIKLRLLSEHPERFPDARRLRRAAVWSRREGLLRRIWQLAGPERAVRSALRLLNEEARDDAFILVAPHAWKALTAKATARLGPRPNRS